MKRLRPGLVASLLAGLIAAGCAATPPQPESMRDPSADFSSFATFSWAPNPGADGADQPLRLLDQNIRAAIAGEMRRLGYSQDDASPDLRIAYETASATKIEDSPVRVGVGMGSWGGSFGSSVNVSSASRSCGGSPTSCSVPGAARNSIRVPLPRVPAGPTCPPCATASCTR